LGEYDYWAGTVSLVVFALAEAIIFSWIYGIDKGWEEIKRGADMKVPEFYKPILKYVTPLFLLFVFVGSVFSPLGGNWNGALEDLFNGRGWPLDNGSLIKQVMNSGLKEQIAQASDGATRLNLEDQLMYINGARILLLVVFLGICALVYAAYRKRIREGKA